MFLRQPKADSPQSKSWLRSLTDYFRSDRTTLYFVGAATVVYFFRATSYITQPQLYAEDGAVWLADGYNLGAKSLIASYNGFFHLAERVVGYFVAQLPLEFAPLIFNLVAWLIFSLFVYYLFSPRTKILTDNYERLFVLLSIFLIANVDEFFYNFSNSIFLLGVIGLLILVAKEARSVFGRILEKLVFIVSCFTLISPWLYLPVIANEGFRHKRKIGFYLFFALAGAIAQISSYLWASIERTVVTFQALVSKFAALEIYNQIVTPALRFGRFDLLLEGSSRLEILLVVSFVLLTLIALIYTFIAGHKQLRYLLFFLAATTVASLKSPLVGPEIADPIRFMASAMWGDRYFIFGIIALYLILSKLSSRLFGLKWRYLFLVAFMSLGLASSVYSRSFFIEKGFQDLRQPYLEGINKLKLGESEVAIPINPNWVMVLKR